MLPLFIKALKIRQDLFNTPHLRYDRSACVHVNKTNRVFFLLTTTNIQKKNHSLTESKTLLQEIVDTYTPEKLGGCIDERRLHAVRVQLDLVSFLHPSVSLHFDGDLKRTGKCVCLLVLPLISYGTLQENLAPQKCYIPSCKIRSHVFIQT